MKRFLKCGVPLVACLLSACDFAPTYVPPSVATPTDFKESADWTPATPRDSAPRGPWWQIFQDPALDRLEDLAMPLMEARAQGTKDRAEIEKLKQDRERLLARIALLENEAKELAGVTDQVEGRLDTAIAEIRAALAR